MPTNNATTNTDYVTATDRQATGAQPDNTPVGGSPGSGGGGGSGTVTSVGTGTGLTGGPITTTGTISANLASSSVFGVVKVDGTSIVASSGVISATGSLTNPMTTLGDMIDGGTSGTPTRLAVQTSGHRRYLAQVSSAAPSWIDAPRFNVEDYGADPAGSATANTTAINAAFTALNSAGGGCLYLPRIYSVNAQFAWTFTGSTYGFSMVGVGMGVSGLVFSGSGTNNGVKITTQVAGSNWTTAPKITVLDLSLIATTNASGTALHIVGPMAAGTGRGNYLPFIARVEIWFESSAYWDVGIDVESCLNGVIDDCVIIGGAPNVGTAGILYHGINSTDELRVVNCTINAWPKSFYGDGTVHNLEGMYFVDNDMTSSFWGIYLDNAAGAGGSVKVTGCYFACSSGAVFVNNIRGVQIVGNQSDANGSGQVHISLYDCFQSNVIGNTLVGTAATGAIGIKVDGSGTGGTLPGVMVSGNVTTTVAIAVQFTSGATNCRMPDHLDTTGGTFNNANTTNLLFEPEGLIRINAATNSLTSGTETTIVWGSADFDDNTLWDGVSTFNIPSWCQRIQFTSFLRFAANATGIRYVKLKDNSGNIWAEAFSVGDSTQPTGIAFTSPWIDVKTLGITSFIVTAFQNSGGSLSVLTAPTGGGSVGYQINHQ